MSSVFLEPAFEKWLVARPLKIGVGEHLGCAIKRRNQITVYHLMGDGQILESSMDEFADGATVRIVSKAPLDTIEFNSRHILARRMNWYYGLIERNCEHYARYLFGGRAVSYQIIAVGVLVGILVAVRLMKK